MGNEANGRDDLHPATRSFGCITKGFPSEGQLSNRVQETRQTVQDVEDMAAINGRMRDA